MDFDALTGVVGQPLMDAEVRALLDDMQVPWVPTIKPPSRSDSLTVRNVELVFEDFEYFSGAQPSGATALVLAHLCFYSPEPGTVGAAPPPLGLTFGSDRHQNREQLAGRGRSSRFGTRDAYELDAFTVVLAYDRADALDSMLLLGRRGERATRAQPPLGFREVSALFGRPWYDDALRSRLYTLADSPSALQEIKRHGTCDLVKEAGLRLLYREAAETRVLDGVEIYRSRVRDAATWNGDLPFGIDFNDSEDDVSRKVGIAPVKSGVRGLERYTRWSLNDVGLLVVFDTVVNLIASITVAGAKRWSS